MIVDFYQYDVDLVLSKLNFDCETNVFSFVYKNIKFETDRYSKSDNGPLSFWGITNNKINLPETDFANNLAEALSNEYDCYVEVRCTLIQSNNTVLAYYKGTPIKEPSLDRKNINQLVRIASKNGDTQKYEL